MIIPNFRYKKTPACAGVLEFGGSGEIRTHGGLLTHVGFQDRCIKPLCHASMGCILQRLAFSIK